MITYTKTPFKVNLKEIQYHKVYPYCTNAILKLGDDRRQLKILILIQHFFVEKHDKASIIY